MEGKDEDKGGGDRREAWLASWVRTRLGGLAGSHSLGGPPSVARPRGRASIFSGLFWGHKNHIKKIKKRYVEAYIVFTIFIHLFGNTASSQKFQHRSQRMF